MIDKKGFCIGAVVIGRNEGERLIACLESLIDKVDVIIYVDSGSTDNSLAEAKVLGVRSIALDMNIPFTAALARNEGANYLIQKHPSLNYIQFVDGDCQVQPEWIETAQVFLDKNKQYAVTCGRRRERFPERSVYNRLCDIEWNTPIGDAMACGGDALIRVKAFESVDGYDKELIAGEEPEMCFRLKQQGWKIYRLDSEMTLHDAAMHRFSQWWKRCMRGGYAFIQGVSMHRTYWVKETISGWIWAAVLPVVVLLLAGCVDIKFLYGLFIYLVQIAKITMKTKNVSYATLIVVAKFPELYGQIKFLANKLLSKNIRIIEYK